MRPLDVFDIAGLRKGEQHPAMGDHWYWCRAHERAESVAWAMFGCVRIGPFMTESEAQRLDDYQQYVDYPGRALGMAVES